MGLLATGEMFVRSDFGPSSKLGGVSGEISCGKKEKKGGKAKKQMAKCDFGQAVRASVTLS